MTDDAMKRKAPEPATSSGLPDNTWTVQQVTEWLENNGYLPAMSELTGVNGKALLGLTKEDLERYGKPPAMGAALYNELHPAVDEDPRGT